MMTSINEIIAIGGLIVAGYFLVSKFLPEPAYAQREKAVSEVGFNQQDYQPCLSNLNCKAYSLFGGDSICARGRCTPLVKSESGIKVSAEELQLPRFCRGKDGQAQGRYYLMGTGSACHKDADCSTDGLTHKAEDSTFAGATSQTYCDKNSQCNMKVKDWAGVWWKREDINAPPISQDYVEKNVASIMALRGECSDVANIPY